MTFFFKISSFESLAYTKFDVYAKFLNCEELAQKQLFVTIGFSSVRVSVKKNSNPFNV